METTIYFFSGTGNSRHIAHQLSTLLGNTVLTDVSKETNKTVIPNAKRVGIVFPVYASGVPRIVTDFIKKMKFDGSEEIFVVSNYAGDEGVSLQEIQNRIQKRNGIVKYGFSIKQPSNYIIRDEAQSLEIQRSILKEADDRISEIAHKIANQQFEPVTKTPNIKKSAVHFMAMKVFPKWDKNFWVDNNCNHCEVCKKICPRGNISITGDQIKWKGNCEVCLACLHWCPQKSIQFKDKTLNKERYTNPNIKMTDIFHA